MASDYTARRGLRMQGARLMAINESLSFDFLDTSLDRFVPIGSGIETRGNSHLKEDGCIYENINMRLREYVKIKFSFEITS